MLANTIFFDPKVHLLKISSKDSGPAGRGGGGENTYPPPPPPSDLLRTWLIVFGVWLKMTFLRGYYRMRVRSSVTYITYIYSCGIQGRHTKNDFFSGRLESFFFRLVTIFVWWLICIYLYEKLGDGHKIKLFYCTYIWETTQFMLLHFPVSFSSSAFVCERANILSRIID